MFKKSEPSQNTVLQIKQDDKFFCRLLTKESSMTNPSFRVAAVTVPFVWESQPGTPKYTFSENTLPPLTPPPSYYSSTSPCKKQVKKRSRSNLLLALLPKLNLKKTILSSSSTSSSSPSTFSSPSWSSSSDSSSSKVVQVRKIGRRRFLSFGSSFDFRGDDKDEVGGDVGSPTSTLCFRIPRSTSNKAKMEFPGSSRR
ncbi:uncharacterized protein LOC130728052 [Lotus japonicus]|nr:uncharacterized protein LOC130728052 [Lotus japonicus]